MPLTDLPYYPAMFALIKQHLSYYQESWTENSPETEVLTFASGRAAMMQTTFWDYGTLTASLSESSFPDGYGLFRLPYFGADTLDYAVEQGWITGEEAEAAAPYAVDRPANVGGAGRHEYGFSVNEATAEDPERLAAAIDFLQYLSSQDVQAQYVETAQSLSPVNGVEIVDALTPFIVEEPEGGYAEEVLGYTVIEWGRAGWDVSVNEFLAGDITWEELVQEVAHPEWAADIPSPEALAGSRRHRRGRPRERARRRTGGQGARPAVRAAAGRPLQRLLPRVHRRPRRAASSRVATDRPDAAQGAGASGDPGHP